MAITRTLVCFAFVATAAITSGQTPQEFFETSIRPVLARSCISCHGPKQQSSSLRLDSRDAMLKGGNRGPALVPGDAGASLPLLAAWLSPVGMTMIMAVATGSLVFLALLGAAGAKAGGAPVGRGMVRVAFWGALAMAITAGIGKLVGTSI